MLWLLAAIFWATIKGANTSSAFIANLLMEKGGLPGWLTEYFHVETVPAFLSVSVYEILHAFFNALATSWWLAGFLVDGVYLGLARVIAVMHPADDDLLPNIHHSGRSGLLAAHRLQYGPILQKGRYAWQTGVKYEHGVWRQRRWCHCRSRYRFIAGTANCYPD